MSDLIFGYTWDEVKKAQQGGTLRKLTPLAAKWQKVISAQEMTWHYLKNSASMV